MREIVIDTETTGLDPAEGHRVLELGCVELVNLVPSGKVFHKYVNPGRPVPEEVTRIHGLTDAFLASHPAFAVIAGEFLDFIGDSRLVAHNAEFDMRFINFELTFAGLKPLPMARAIDTLQLARARFPGSPNNLDALCKRLGVDNSSRTKHGAFLDSEILAAVYLELRGGRQAGLELVSAQGAGKAEGAAPKARPPRSFPPSEKELEAHQAFLAGVKEPLWLK
ncbi:MAG TPA: DNA polymerase III subunit epsilon [Sphingomonadales bacterium]|nr:DNA polymerase III subunit epsilon [Sphingomonadales bacterium]